MTLAERRQIGDVASRLDRSSLIAAANARLNAMKPELESALLEQHRRLQEAQREGMSPQSLFGPAHQIRALAGPAGRPHLGVLADVIARFVTESADRGIVHEAALLNGIGHALSRAFAHDDADSMLTDAAALVTQLLDRLSSETQNGANSPLI